MRGDQEYLKQLVQDARNLVYYDQADNLREKVWDEMNVFSLIEEVESILIEDDQERYQIYFTLGYLYRLVNYLEQSQQHYKWCLAYLSNIYSEEDIELLMAYLRYSETLRLIDPSAALELLNVVEARAKSGQHQDILDFIYQQQAKSYLVLKDYSAALNYFEQALKIRQTKKDNRLIKATQSQLALVKQLISRLAV